MCCSTGEGGGEGGGVKRVGEGIVKVDKEIN